MTTALIIAASGWAAERIEAAIPPACRRPVAPAPIPRIDGDEAVIELPALAFGYGVRHLLPAFSALSPLDYSVRLELSVLAAGAWSPWVGGAALGPAAFPPIATRTPAVDGEVDVFVTPEPVAGARVRVRLRAFGVRRLLAAPWFVALSASDAAPPSPPSGGSEDAAGPSGTAVRLPVPALSQMEDDAAIRHRICSPASTAMVLGYWGRSVAVTALAAELLHHGLDLYGVWPAAIRSAGRRGVAGYLLRFPDWASAAWCLERGMPIIASVRYGAGELGGAAIAETAGHLIVLTGYEDDRVHVNDPAAPTAADVPRRYRREELCRVWLGRAGVGYVLFTPAPTTCPSGRSRRRPGTPPPGG